MQNNERVEIPVSVRICFDGAVLSEELIQILKAVEKAVFSVELQELRGVRSAFPMLSVVALDAAEFRLSQVRGRAMAYSNAKEGSIVLIGAIGGLSYFILDKTLGQTISEAWAESDANKKLKDFLKKRLSLLAIKTAKEISKEVSKKGLSVSAQHSDAPGNEAVSVTVNLHDVPAANNSLQARWP